MESIWTKIGKAQDRTDYYSRYKNPDNQIISDLLEQQKNIKYLLFYAGFLLWEEFHECFCESGSGNVTVTVDLNVTKHTKKNWAVIENLSSQWENNKAIDVIAALKSVYEK